jgi:hypothetical protein
MEASGEATYGVEFKVDPTVRHKVLRSAMVFPRTVGLKDGKVEPIVTAYYKCEAGSACDFSTVYTAIDRSQDLRAWGVNPMLTEILDDIKAHPSDYAPELYDGFLINRDGKDLVRLGREGAAGNGRTGFIEYNNYRHSMIEEARTARIIAAINARASMPIPSTAKDSGQCVVS